MANNLPKIKTAWMIEYDIEDVEDDDSFLNDDEKINIEEFLNSIETLSDNEDMLLEKLNLDN